MLGYCERSPEDSDGGRTIVRQLLAKYASGLRLIMWNFCADGEAAQPRTFRNWENQRNNWSLGCHASR